MRYDRDSEPINRKFKENEVNYNTNTTKSNAIEKESKRAGNAWFYQDFWGKTTCVLVLDMLDGGNGVQITVSRGYTLIPGGPWIPIGP